MTGVEGSSTPGDAVPARRPSDEPVPPLPLTPTGAVTYWTTGLTVVLAALACAAAFAGTWALTAVVVLASVLLAWGWPDLLDLPSPRRTSVVVAVSGAAAALAVALTDDEPRLEWLALALAGAVVLEFVHQLVRRDGRPRLVESVSGSVAGAVVLASLSTVIALPSTPATASSVLLWAVPVAVALAALLLPLPARLASALGLVGAALVGGVLGGLLADGTVESGLLAGGVCAAVSLMVHRLLAVRPSAGRAPGWVALAVAPLSTSGMVAYVVLRLTLG